jgi:hypothetical protein
MFGSIGWMRSVPGATGDGGVKTMSRPWLYIGRFEAGPAGARELARLCARVEPFL